jgi:hypothetical protein
MNRIILIGNGFDLAHGLKTSYKHFIDWFWEEEATKVIKSNVRYEDDCLNTKTVFKLKFFITRKMMERTIIAI